jgi:hypothetical protein
MASILGVPYKVFYAAKNFKTGLTDISAKIVKSDGVVIGPILLAELPEPGFTGTYTATIATSESDPEGDWLGIVNENGHSYPFRVTMRNRLDNPIDIDELAAALFQHLPPRIPVVYTKKPRQIDLEIKISDGLSINIQPERSIDVEILLEPSITFSVQPERSIDVEIIRGD